MLALLPLLLAGGCQTLGYYAQAIGGQMEIWHASRPIAQLVQDEAIDPALRERLGRVREIRAFASDALALPDNRSYRVYADLGRPYVVWNVFAAPEFSLRPREWCFPFAGCVAYRGYYARERAERYAARLSEDGMDVYVGGVPAYSTLGWFADPVLNTFVHYPDPELARLIFHELAHQVVYVRDDTAFNESYAVAVELEGVRRWLAATGTPAQQAAFDTAQARRGEFLALFERYRAVLAAVYATDAPEADMRAAKARAFARMRADYARLRESWDGFDGYDAWFDEPLNNARLVSVAAYAELVPGFQALLAGAGGDFARFHTEVRRLAGLEKSARRRALETAARVLESRRETGPAGPVAISRR